MDRTRTILNDPLDIACRDIILAYTSDFGLGYKYKKQILSCDAYNPQLKKITHEVSIAPFNRKEYVMRRGWADTWKMKKYSNTDYVSHNSGAETFYYKGNYKTLGMTMGTLAPTMGTCDIDCHSTGELADAEQQARLIKRELRSMGVPHVFEHVSGGGKGIHLIYFLAGGKSLEERRDIQYDFCKILTQKGKDKNINFQMVEAKGTSLTHRKPFDYLDGTFATMPRLTDDKQKRSFIKASKCYLQYADLKAYVDANRHLVEKPKAMAKPDPKPIKVSTTIISDELRKNWMDEHNAMVRHRVITFHCFNHGMREIEQVESFIKTNKLFTGDWLDNASRRQAHIAHNLNYASDNQKTHFDNNILQNARELIKEINLPLPSCNLTNRVKITPDDQAIFLYVASTLSANEDGSMPMESVKAFWTALYADGKVNRAYSTGRAKHLRNQLAMSGLIDMRNRKYCIGQFAMCWSVIAEVKASIGLKTREYPRRVGEMNSPTLEPILSAMSDADFSSYVGAELTNCLKEIESNSSFTYSQNKNNNLFRLANLIIKQLEDIEPQQIHRNINITDWQAEQLDKWQQDLWNKQA